MFIDVPGSVVRIIRPCNVEEKLRKAFFPDNIKEIKISVFPVENFFDTFPLPKDCQKIVMLHIFYIITGLLKESNFNDEDLLNISLGYSSKISSKFPEILYEIKKTSLTKEWKNLKEKYKHDQVVLESLEQVFYYIIYLDHSEPIIKKEISKINERLKREIIMQKTQFSKDLNDLLDTLFSVGVNKPIDITIYLVVCSQLGNKAETVCNEDIMEKLGITEKEYLDSIKRLEKHGVLSARMPTNEERENAATV